MKRMIGCCVAITLLLVGVASAEPGDTLLNVKNDANSTVGVWVRSEKNLDPNPWRHQVIAARTSAQFTLRSPDRYIIVVDMGQQRSRSKPVELKEFINKHPDYVMKLNVQQLAGGPLGGGGGGGGGMLTGSVGSEKYDPNSDPTETMYLEFGPEPNNR